jgi:hypothetical protein
MEVLDRRTPRVAPETGPAGHASITGEKPVQPARAVSADLHPEHAHRLHDVWLVELGIRAEEDWRRGKGHALND